MGRYWEVFPYGLLPLVFNMSVTAGILIPVVLVLRLLLRRAPKIFSYLLWGVVLFRLLCPVSLTSPFSLLNVLDTPVTERGAIEYVPVEKEYQENRERLPVEGELWISQDISREEERTGERARSLGHPEPLIFFLTHLWLLGILVLAAYSVISLFMLRRKVACSMRLRDNIYLADHISTPFVLGLFCPRIYLPSFLGEEERNYIILHERYHIRRGDHVVKLLAFAAQCLHWFNPLVWIAFVLAGRDMEMSCDEAVMGRMEQDIRAEYSASLLRLATGNRFIVSYPLAFGEGDPKMRIINVMRYRKPARWVAVAAAVYLAAAVLCLVTNPGVAQTGGGSLPGDGSISAGADGEAAQESPASQLSPYPGKEEVLAARETVLQGMTREQSRRLTENIKIANQVLEEAYLYHDIFGELEDPDSFYWNYFDQKGTIQIGWSYEGSAEELNKIRKQENLTVKEAVERYGVPVETYNRFDAGNFVALIEDMQGSVHNKDLWDDLQRLIDETRLAAKTHEMEHANNIYRILHDMDYFLLRYGPEDVGKYAQDDSVVCKYYGTLTVYNRE